MIRRSILPGVLAAAALTACGAGGDLQATVADRDADPENLAFVDRELTERVVAEVRRAVGDLLSYSYTDLAEVEQDGRELATGSFAGEHQNLVRDSVVPTATAQQIVTNTEVAAAGVQQLDEDSARLLLFLDQETRSNAQPAPVHTGSRITVTATRVGDRWLISELGPV